MLTQPFTEPGVATLLTKAWDNEKPDAEERARRVPLAGRVLELIPVMRGKVYIQASDERE